MLRRVLLCGLCAAAAIPAPAQQENNAGYGGIYRRIDLNALTGNKAHLGVCDVGGNLYVSARDPQLKGNHVIYQITPAGALTTLPQPAVQSQSPWGMRDLCTDGSSIAGGSEVGVSIVDTTGALATTWAGQPVAQPIGGAILAAVGTIRGLAWDGAANHGNGLFYTVDYDSAIVAFDTTGAVFGTWPNAGWSGYGLALDPVTGNLWVNAAPDRGAIAEIDRTTFQLTGHTIEPAVPFARPGGLSEASIVAGHHAPWGTLFNLVQLSQGNPDVLVVNRVHLLAGKPGWNEMRLQVDANGTGWHAGRAYYGPGDTLGLRVFDPTNLKSGLPCWVIFNLLPEAAIDGITDLSPFLPGFGILVEQRTRNSANVLNPTSNFMILPWSVGPADYIPLPPGPVLANDLIRIQALLLDLSNPTGFTSSNEAWWQGGPSQAGILVEAVGPDSFHGGPDGFWRVTHLGGGRPAIRSVTLDWTACTVPGQESIVFDVAQDRMHDRHDGGNCQVAGFHGTYRNGSDVTAGLDYGFAGNHVPAFATGSENSGFASTTIAADGTARDLTYRFTGTTFGPGITFEFDCDTDGGLGVSGKAMAGLPVQIVLTDNTMLTGVLAVDPTHPCRSFVLLP